MYLRQNGSQEFLGDLRDTSQSTVSRIVTTLVPIVKAVLEEFVPTAKEAIELVNGRVCLVDGTITPAGPMPITMSCGAVNTARPGSTRSWSACSMEQRSTFPIPSLERLMMPRRSSAHRLLRSFGTLAAGSVTKVIKDAVWSPT